MTTSSRKVPKLERFNLDGVKGINHINILKGFINQYNCHAIVPEFLSVVVQCLMNFFSFFILRLDLLILGSVMHSLFMSEF